MQNTVGDNIHRLRRSAGYTIPELASKSGVSAGGISKIERGEVTARHSTLDLIADALGCTVDFLCGFKWTMGDKIRGMDDEELAHFLSQKFAHGFGEEQYLAWLRTPADE